MDETGPLTAHLARALIRSLNRGTAVAKGARFIHVGQREWLDAQLEMLDEVAEDGTAETKFVRGAYGAGKSHFLSVVQDFARERNWVTSHVECKTDHVEIDRFETLYPRIVEKLLVQEEASDRPTSGAPPDQLRRLLDRWSKKVMKKAGLRDNALTRPFDADERVYGYFERELFRSSLPTQFIHALLVYCRASLEGHVQLASAVVAWLRGSPEVLSVPGRYVASAKRATSARNMVLRPIGRGAAHDAMRALLWLIRDAEYAGLVLCVDEVEELARLGTQKRQDQALQALREFVDHAGGEGGYQALCMYLAATPEMFESERYFPRYDALATRIQPLGEGINWRGPVVDLERKPLTRAEMASISERIAGVYAIAYGEAVQPALTAQIVKSVVDAVMASRYRIAKPRLLARMLVDQLERARSRGADYSPPSDLTDAAAQAAAALLDGASA